MSKSEYIRRLKKMPENNFKLNDFEHFEFLKHRIKINSRGSFPPDELINKIGCRDFDHYISSMINQFADLQKRFSPCSDWNILDLGCGVGRTAFPFKEFTKIYGIYYGVDVWDDGVKWCKNNFNENFKFYCLISNDNYYFNEKSTGKANNYNLEFIPNASIDLVIAVSTFTHLLKNDLRSYLSEICRVLKKGACGYITCFLIDKYFDEYRKLTKEFLAVKEAEEGCYYGYSGQDIFAGYSLNNWNKWLCENNLELVNYELGKWAQKPGAANYQDLLIIRH